jgi:hypothetical protein
MAQFQINKYDYTTHAEDFNQLMSMAKSGQLEPSDLVKPQGSNDWLYAGELPNIKELLSISSYAEEPTRMPAIIGSLCLIGTLVCGYLAFENQKTIPSESDLQLIGSDGLEEDDALLTNTAKIFADPEGRKTLATINKNDSVTLLDKKGTMFNVEYSGGKGWISISDLAPLYLFAGEKIRKEYQARFDPHRFVNLLNPSWSRPEYGSDKTNISFQLQNLSPYPVENIVVTVTIKDSNGAVKQKEFFEIKGVIQDGDTSSVYTVSPPPKSEEGPILVTRSELEKMEKADRSVQDRILDSIERSFDKGSVGPISMRVTQANAMVKDPK